MLRAVVSTQVLLACLATAQGQEIETLAFRDLRDAKRDRKVPIKVFYPEREGRFPLVIFSHGGAGTWDANVYQAKDLAKRGYVVLSVEHVFSNNLRVRELMRRGRGRLRARLMAALQAITKDPRAVLERPKDISFAIDQAVKWNASSPHLKDRIDTSKIAVAGHSFGAYTVLVVCGARPILDHLQPRVEPGKGLAPDLSDPRVTVGIAFSPQGLGTSRFGPGSFDTVNRPLLCFSGPLDSQLGHDGSTQPAQRRLDGFKQLPKGDKYMLWLANTDHMAFSDNPKSHLLPSRSRPDAQRIAKAMSAVFCDTYLKGSARAKGLLTEEHANTLCGRVVTKVTWHQR